jgi:mRNA capping enzyme, catalytic domain/mRNA capping enzyme, beta chain/mRNA capping enzyme, C-terminal domain
MKAPFGLNDRRVCSSGPKQVNGKTAKAFHCSDITPPCQFESGITRSHNVHWTQAGLSEVSPLSYALAVGKDDTHVRRDVIEVDFVETVYGGYPHERRVCFPGVHPSKTGQPTVGKMENKERLLFLDLAIPAAPYDVRIQLATEKLVDANIPDAPPPGWTTKRVKRRRSYSRRDKSIAWQIDVTEVTTTYIDTTKPAEVTYELEMELSSAATLKLINDDNPDSLRTQAKSLASQLWWILHNINPLSDVLDVEDFLRDHPDSHAVRLAQAQCGALKQFMSGGGSNHHNFQSPVLAGGEPSPALANVNFVGCMPVNFSRHNIEEVQRSPENGYFLSEKTDGVRHFLIFTGKTAVLIDRAMRGKQPIPRSAEEDDPLGYLLPLIKPGTVFDGEVVMHRKLRRPIFIVFDILAIPEPVLQLPFEQRLNHLRRASFRTSTAQRDMFDPKAVGDPKVALPLIRKNFVKRQALDDLLAQVTEEKGMRCYRHGETHNHLTDGIIFQPNTPYVCGTDVTLLKWKYLDTVTIDVEILPARREGELCVGCLGDDNARIDMTRHLHLPESERRRLEADREETNCKIAEVGFDATTGEWYYLTMRPDKIAPNHISTVLGTLLELAESLTTEELRYRMSVPPGARDTYRKDVRGMQKQLLDHQRKKNKSQQTGNPAPPGRK